VDQQFKKMEREAFIDSELEYLKQKLAS